MISVLTVDNIIAEEVNMYVRYCELAAEHEPDEKLHRQLAHVIFYHIQELRTTGKLGYIPKELADSPIFTR
jgi:hypothetical protein